MKKLKIVTESVELSKIRKLRYQTAKKRCLLKLYVRLCCDCLVAATSFDKELLDTGGRLSANPSYRSNVSRKELDQDLIPIQKIQNSVSSTTMSTSGESRGKQSEFVERQNLEKGF